jgi:hypothetical protein
MFICFNRKQIKTILADKMSSHKVQIWTVMIYSVCLEKRVNFFARKSATHNSQFLTLHYV